MKHDAQYNDAITQAVTEQQIDRNNPETWYIAVGQPAYEAIREMVEAMNNAETDEQQEQARETIENDPLSVEVRSSWFSPGSEDYNTPAEYKILLSTGGPATRIIGQFSEYGEPETATLQVQDWSKPWTDYTQDVAESILLDYARCFSFSN